MLREFLDGVLGEIESESLTDLEYDALPEGLDETYSRAVYDGLKIVVQNREGVSGQLRRLKGLFESKGVDLCGVPSRIASSQIIVGFALD